MVHEPKVAVLGSKGVGKTALQVQFTQNMFVEKYDPVIESEWRKQAEIDMEIFLFTIYDDLSNYEFPAMRDLAIKESHCFILVYNITSKPSFDEIPSFVEMILKVKETQPPMILLGNKLDLDAERVVLREQGEELAKKYGIPFRETSAKARINVDESFYDLMRFAQKTAALFLSPNSKKRKEQQLLEEKKQREKEEARARAIDKATPKIIPSPPSVQIAPSSFISDIKPLVNNKEWSDISFLARSKDNEWKPIYAHSLILFTHCNHMMEVMKEGQKEFKVEDISYDTMLKLMEYVYTGSLDLKDSNLKELMTAADKFHIQSLKSNIRRAIEANITEVEKLGYSTDWIIGNLSVLVNAELGSDVVFILDDGQRLHAHKLIVSMRCPYFAQMFKSGLKEGKQKEVEMKETHPEAFRVAIEHIYTDDVNLAKFSNSGEFVCDLLLLSHRLGLVRLVNACEQFITYGLEVSNVAFFLQLAHTLEATQLENNCKHFISYRFNNVKGTSDFKKLPKGVRTQLKSSRKEGVWQDESDSVIRQLTKKFNLLKATKF